MAVDPQPLDPQQLPAKWRSEAKSYELDGQPFHPRADAKRSCAAELEAALASAQQLQAKPPAKLLDFIDGCVSAVAVDGAAASACSAALKDAVTRALASAAGGPTGIQQQECGCRTCEIHVSDYEALAGEYGKLMASFENLKREDAALRAQPSPAEEPQ